MTILIGDEKLINQQVDIKSSSRVYVDNGYVYKSTKLELSDGNIEALEHYVTFEPDGKITINNSFGLMEFYSTLTGDDVETTTTRATIRIIKEALMLNRIEEILVDEGISRDEIRVASGGEIFWGCSEVTQLESGSQFGIGERSIIVRTPFIEGESINNMQPEDISPEELTIEFGKVLKQLEILQRYGIAHRDIKPSNLVFTRRTDKKLSPKITVIDFGGATEANESSLLHFTPAEFIGTYSWLSPEQGNRTNGYLKTTDRFCLLLTYIHRFISLFGEKHEVKSILTRFEMDKNDRVSFIADMAQSEVKYENLKNFFIKLKYSKMKSELLSTILYQMLHHSTESRYALDEDSNLISSNNNIFEIIARIMANEEIEQSTEHIELEEQQYLAAAGD